MIVTDGGRFGGYGLYLLKGKPVFTYNLLAVAKARWEGQEPLTLGKHTLKFDFKYDGPGMAKGGTGRGADASQERRIEFLEPTTD